MAKRRLNDESAGGCPRRLVKAWAALVALGLVAVLAAACGGEEGPEVTGSPTAAPGPGDAALAPCEALAALRTYRYSVGVTVESSPPAEDRPESEATPTGTSTPGRGGSFFTYAVDASVVAPDRLDAWLGTEDARFRMIAIGHQTWIQVEDEWTEMAQPMEVPYQPLQVCEAILPDLDLSQVEPQQEKLNDVTTLHYTFDQLPSEQAMAKIFGPGSDAGFLFKKVDVGLWLAEKDRWPVRIDISSSGRYDDGTEIRAQVLVEITDANSDDIRVEAPL